MTSNINPSGWASWDLRVKDQQFDTKMQVLLNQLSQFAVATQQAITTLQSASGLAAILNGSGSLVGSSFASRVVDLGTITTDQTVNAAGAQFVGVKLVSGVGQTRILTINNLPIGGIVHVDCAVTVGTLTLQMAATNPSTTVYTIIAFQTSTAAATDMVGVGKPMAAVGEFVFLGMAITIGAVPRLNLYFI